MLRLFRNFLCLASVLQVGAAVQAQQPPSKTAIAPAAKSQAVSTSKAAKAEPAVVSTKVAGPASSAKPSPAKPFTAKPESVAAAAPKPAKAEPAAVPMKSAAVPAKSAKAEPATAAVKTAKTEPATAVSKAVKTVPASATSKTAKTDPAAAPLKMGPAKPVKGETVSKFGKSAESVAQQKRASAPRPGLVPPPPPDTPTVFAGDGFPPGFGMFDYNNPAALAGRRKDIASQLASAKKMLIDKEQRAKELKEKAVQFEQLFSEGVISRRELESAQKDSASALTELSDAKTQAISYQNAMSRLDERMKPKSVATKKNAKGKIKAAAKSSLKVAGTSTTSTKTTVTTTKNTSIGVAGSATAPSTGTATTATTTTPTATDSTAHAALKATPGP